MEDYGKHELERISEIANKMTINEYNEFYENIMLKLHEENKKEEIFLISICG